jgi:D-cysteine desulfhydrase family pyridoxal phosphate-dependent enzyme
MTPEGFAVLPTPVQRMDRLAAALDTGATLLVKRDDLTGLGLGGNKVRKLAFLTADALAAGADCLVTGGGPQSNHARLTAAAAARLGLGCHLALGGPASVPRDGNLLLDELFGATLHFDGADRYYGVEAAITALATRLRDEGARPYAIPVGGASMPGVAAYAHAVDELRGQVGADPDHMVVADGSGGTHAGLLAGLGVASRTRVLGVHVGTRPDLEVAVPRLASDASDHLGRGPANAAVHIDRDHVGGGYGQLSAACVEALRLVARTEGLVLDPVYSGKAMAALITALRRGDVLARETVVFWATGGSPALFAGLTGT